MKTYTVDVRYYIQAENEDDLFEQLKQEGIIYSEYYGGYYEIIDIEEDEE